MTDTSGTVKYGTAFLEEGASNLYVLQGHECSAMLPRSLLLYSISGSFLQYCVCLINLTLEPKTPVSDDPIALSKLTCRLVIFQWQKEKKSQTEKDVKNYS